MDKTPTDDEILAAVKRWGNGSMTYVVRNVLWSQGFRKETPWVLRQLKRLEKRGLVERVPSPYAVQIKWAVVE